MKGITRRMLFPIKTLSAVLLAAGLAGWLRPAAGEDAPEGHTVIADDPAAHKLFDQMLEALRNSKSLSYEARYQRKAGDNVESACTYRVWLKKPNYFRVETTSLSGEQEGVLIGDGDTLWIHWPKGRPRWEFVRESEADEQTRFTSYMTKPAPQGNHSIWHEMLYLGGGMSFPIMELSTFHGYEDPIHEGIDGVRSLGAETVSGEDCHRIEVSLLGGQRRWFLSLSTRDHLPRKLKEVVKVSYDNVTYEEWSSVTINGDIPDALFAWRPPAGWVQWKLPDAEDRLLTPGSRAPDFELASVEGDRIKLSNYEGKTVWLCFWRLGCPPCRKETPLLEALYTRFKDKDFVVIGVNVDDDRALALEYLRQQGVTFPTIVDPSAAAQKICHEDYGGGGVPLNYLIDGKGQIVHAAFEYAPVKAALNRLRPELAVTQ